MQLAQVQALEIRLITKIFRITSVQALNVEAYLTSIGFKLDKKADQIATCLYFGLLYQIALLKVLNKRYAKLFSNNIYKLEKKPAYITALW